MSKKIYPEKVKYYIADNILSDSSKPQIIGLFPDDIVGLALSSEQLNPSKENPLMLQSLAIMIVFIGCRGPFDAEISLYLPDCSALIEHEKTDLIISPENRDKESNITFIARFMPFQVTQLGLYKLVFKLDSIEYKYEFNIVRLQK